MSNVIVLSSDEDEDEDTVPLPVQKAEQNNSYVIDEEFDYGASTSFDALSTESDKWRSTSSAKNGMDHYDGPVKRSRFVHDLSDSDDDTGSSLGIRKKPEDKCQKMTQSSDDELPDININLGPSILIPKRKEFDIYNSRPSPCRSTESAVAFSSGKQKREEQQLRKQQELAEKAKQRQTKQEEREQKKIQAAHAKDLKKATAEIERAKKKGECIKWISVILDPGLLNADYSGELLTALRSSEIDYKVEECIIPFSAHWERRLQKVHVDENMAVQKITSTQSESFALVVWLWNKLISEVYESTLHSTVEEMTSLLQGKELTLAIFGLEEYFRYQKTQKRRDVHSDVLGTGSIRRKAKEGSVDAAPMVSRGDVEFALAELQVRLNVNHRILNSKTDLANLVCQFSKAIAEAPIRRENNREEGLDWYAQGDSKDCVAVDKDGNGSLQLWHRHLCQFPLASRETSEAIASVYPSPQSLLCAYDKCSNEDKAQRLLEDIPVRRGPGPLSSTRRIGPQLSKKIYSFYSTIDENCLIAPD